jgi:nitroreductase
MEYFEVVKARYSARAYADRPVASQDLDRILETVSHAPSAGNLQAYEIYVTRDSSRLAALAKAAHGQDFVARASVALIFCANPERSRGRYGARGVKLYAVQDATIACTYAMLAATALGLGSVWVGAFDELQVRQVIGAPAEITPVAILPIGYAADEIQAHVRRSLDDLVHWLDAVKG